jgi:hypothetical protein
MLGLRLYFWGDWPAAEPEEQVRLGRHGFPVPARPAGVVVLPHPAGATVPARPRGFPVPRPGAAP